MSLYNSQKSFIISEWTQSRLTKVDKKSHLKWQNGQNVIFINLENYVAVFHENRWQVTKLRAIFVGLESKLGFVSTLEMTGGNIIFALISSFTAQLNDLIC